MRTLIVLSVLILGCTSVVPSTSSTAPLPSATPAPQPAPAKVADSTPTVLSEAQVARDRTTAVKVQAIIDAFTNNSPILLRDGRVVYVSTRSGLPALYIADTHKPAEAPRKLNTPDERVTSATLLPDEHTLLFLSDVKSDGNFRIFRVNLDDPQASAENITPDELLHRDPPHVARKVPGLFCYGAHSVSDATTRVLMQRTEGGPAREVYRDAQSGEVLDLAADGKKFLFAQIHAENEQVLFEVDVDSGHARQLFPHDQQKLPVTDAAYSADGKSILISSFAADKAPWIERIEPKSGRVLARYEDRLAPTGRVLRLRVAPAGGQLAVTLDAGNHMAIRLLDATSLSHEKTLAIPLGGAFAGPFRADGKQLGLTLSVPQAPTDIHAVDVGTLSVSKLREDARPGLDAAKSLRSSIVQVPSFDGLSIPVNLYLPESAEKRPVVVLVHGGPSGSASMSFNAEVLSLSNAGFVVVQPNIRGSTGFGLAYEQADDREKRGAALKDIEAINAWARAQPFCDGRLVIMGTSYGGYMTLLALTRSPGIWQAGVDNSGMSDLKTMEQLEDQSIRIYDETEFGKLGRDDALLEEWSPLKDMSKIAAPVFIYQGKNDPITPQEQADRMVKAVREKNIPVEYMLAADEGHGVVRRDNRIAYLARVIRFLDEHL